MKNFLILMFVIFFNSWSFANTVDSVFKQNSVLSQQAKVFLLNHLKDNCKLGITPYGLFEEKSQIEKQENSGNSQIITYSTQFDSKYYNDGMHPSSQKIDLVFEEVIRKNQARSEFTLIIFDALCEEN